jgi:hypothetical protein
MSAEGSLETRAASRELSAGYRGDEITHIGNGVGSEQRVDASHVADSAVMHHEHAIRDLTHHAEIMRDEQEG